jgi:thiamine biosynthesis lipoprotein
VAAGTCLDANIASTAAIIRGDSSVSWLEGLGLPSRLVDIDGRVRHVAGWPAEGDDLPEGSA